MTLHRKIPATIVTGFLGAGKTSLIRHLLANARGKKLALVINEFGALGIDRELLLGCGDATCSEEDIVELANGCICCTVADDFLPTMEKLLARDEPPDHIIIETSGLALPKPLVKAFAWPEVAGRVTVDAVVVVVDGSAVADETFNDPRYWKPGGPAPDHDLPLAEVFGDQLACADLVIVNKSDLLDDARQRTVTEALRNGLRASVKLISASHAAVDIAVLLGLEAEVESDLSARPSHHDALPGHDHDDFESFVVALPPIVDKTILERALRAAGNEPRVLRIKGFAAVAGKELRLAVQGVGPRLSSYFDRPWRDGESREGAVVVIGQKGLDRERLSRLILDATAPRVNA
ncbi:MAG: cobalamin biosynthesis protein CobW [Alphaproteobacteria bacterium]